MAKTPTEIDALPTYTNAQMVKLCDWCIAELISNPAAQVMGPNNRSYTYRDLDQLRRMRQEYAALADAEAAETAGGGPFEYANLNG